MADASTKIILTGEDRTKSAFASASRNVKALQANVEGLIAPLGGLRTIAATVATAVGAISLKSTIDAADLLANLSQRTGVAVEGLSALRYAGALADLSVEDLGDGLKKLNQNIAAAARGEKEQAAAFNAIGVAVKNADGSLRSTEEILGDIAEKFPQYADGANKVALATALGGRAFEKWIQLLNGGREGLEAARRELEKFGGVMTAELAANSERFNDNLTKLGFALEALKIKLGGELIADLADLAEAVARFARDKDVDSGINVIERIGRVVPTLPQTRIAGGLLSLFGLGDDDNFDNKIKAAQKEVQHLQELLDKFNASGDTRAPRIENQLAGARERLHALTVGGGRGTVNPPLVDLRAAGAKPDAPKLPGSSAADDAAAAARKKLDGELKRNEQQLAAFRDIEEFHAQFVKGLHDDSLISLDAFYEHQRLSRESALQATREAFDAEKTLLEKHRAKLTKPQDRADIDNKLGEVAQRRAAFEREASQAAALSAEEQRRAAAALAENVKSLDAQLAALTGNGAPAQLLDIARQVKAAQDLLAKSGGDPAKAQELGRLLELQRQFTAVRGDFERATDAAAIAEERLLLASETRGDGLLETEQAVHRLRQASLDQLDRLIERTQALAEATMDPEVLQYLEQLRLQRDRAAPVVDPTKLRFEEAAGEGARVLVDGLRQAVVEGGNLRDIIKDIDKRLASIVLDEIAFKRLEKWLRDFLKPGAAGLGGILSGGAPVDISAGGIDRSVAGIVDNPTASRDALRALEAGAYETTEALTGMASDTSTVSAVLGALPATAATPAAGALLELALAARQASIALLSVGSGGGAGAGLAGLFSGSGSGATFSGFGGGEASFSSGAAALTENFFFFHDGGVVGRDLVAPTTFGNMEPGLVMPAPLKLKPNERRAVLELGEEVITEDDPRHRDKHGRALLQVLPKYHTGGIVGDAADSSPIARLADAAVRGAERQGLARGETGGGVVINNTINVPAGTPRETANQIANRIAERAAFGRRRNG